MLIVLGAHAIFDALIASKGAPVDAAAILKKEFQQFPNQKHLQLAPFEIAKQLMALNLIAFEDLNKRDKTKIVWKRKSLSYSWPLCKQLNKVDVEDGKTNATIALK
jgi:hypothetical protein